MYKPTPMPLEDAEKCLESCRSGNYPMVSDSYALLAIAEQRDRLLLQIRAIQEALSIQSCGCAATVREVLGQSEKRGAGSYVMHQIACPFLTGGLCNCQHIAVIEKQVDITAHPSVSLHPMTCGKCGRIIRTDLCTECTDRVCRCSCHLHASWGTACGCCAYPSTRTS